MLKHRCVAVLLLAALAAVADGQRAMSAELQSVSVEGTEFVAALSDGRVLRSPDLAGVVLDIGTSRGKLRVRIDAVERDPDAKGAAVWLHTLSTQGADGSWQNPCEAGPDGRRQGFPLAFRPRQSDGQMEPAAPGAFELICTGGARGKCVRFGYPPWQGAAMLGLYNACIRMVRADYCGEGEGTTRNGMSIDPYDDRAIQIADNDKAQEFEAGWTERGAVCVRHVRVKDNTSLEVLAKSCPRLRNALGEGCTEEQARTLGGTLFNRSRP